MTDSELIKALDNKIHGSDYACFEDYEILALIKRQQTEIKKLERARQKQAYLLCNLKGQKYELMNRISIVKNEAYKEFAERLKSYLLLNKKGEMSVISFENIDTLLKEMVGEENERNIV